MRKIITAIIASTISLLTVFGMTACNGNSSHKVSLTSPGNIIEASLGGFVAETENYVYYINGVGESTAKNDFGTPLKGALMVADKATLGGEVKTEVVVPKLFVASDYNAGVYIFGEGENSAVYYATPSVEKNSDGKVANTHLTFMKTTLNGKKTESFITVEGIGTNYRMAEKDGVVYIVFYDNTNKELKTYNTSKKELTTIAKVDEKTREGVQLEDSQDKVFLTFDSYRFLEVGCDTTVVFTMKAYAEDYYEEKAEGNEEYQRAEAKFNVMYSYSVGDVKDENGVVGKMIANGEKENIKYAITLVEDGYVFFTETSINNKVKNYASSTKDLTKKTLIEKVDNVKDLIVINDKEGATPLDEYFYKFTPEGTDVEDVIYKSTLVGDAIKVRERVLANAKVSSLLYIDGDYMYYYTTGNKLARCNYKVADAKEELISEDVVASTWFDPEIVEANGKKFIFYADSSVEGSSYIKYVDLTKETVEKEDDKGNKYMTFEGQALIGIMTETDKANPVKQKINNLAAKDFEYTVVEGKVKLEGVKEARDAYEALSKESKKSIGEDLITKLENAEKAQALANEYYKLKEFEKYADLSDAEKKTFEEVYNQVKAYRQKLVNEDSTRFITIRDMVNDEILYMYQESVKLFKTDK